MHSARQTRRNNAKPATEIVKAQSKQRVYPAVDARAFAGPAWWVTLHSAATTYTPEQRSGFLALIRGTAETFPCPKCRENFKKHLLELPVEKYLGNRDEAFLWTYLMHDKVNQLKRVKSPPLQDVKRYYFESLGVNCSNC